MTVAVIDGLATVLRAFSMGSVAEGDEPTKNRRVAKLRQTKATPILLRAGDGERFSCINGFKSDPDL